MTTRKQIDSTQSRSDGHIEEMLGMVKTQWPMSTKWPADHFARMVKMVGNGTQGSMGGT